jgi:hypothetical protein
LKPAQASSLRDPILKKAITKKGQLKVEALNSNPSTTTTKRKI